MRQLTWQELLLLEPRLGDLMADVRRVRDAADFCAHAVWYGSDDLGGLREQMSQLVGWDRSDDARLGSQVAYDVAYEALYDELPDCRHRGSCQG